MDNDTVKALSIFVAGLVIGTAFGMFLIQMDVTKLDIPDGCHQSGTRIFCES